MSLTAGDIKTLREMFKEEVQQMLDDLGLFSGTEHEITERRADFKYLRDQRKSHERIVGQIVNKLVWLLIIGGLLATRDNISAWVGDVLDHLSRLGGGP